MRLQYWRDLGAVEEQRREETRVGGSRNCFPSIVTFVCFKVKVGAIWSPLSLSFLYFLSSQNRSSHFWNTTEEGAIAPKALVIL